MEIIKAFKTSDGQIHGNQILAAQHEFRIAIRGYFNRNVGKDNLSVLEAARLITNHDAELSNILIQNRRAINRVTNMALAKSKASASKASSVKK